MFNRFRNFLKNLLGPRRVRNVIDEIDGKTIFPDNQDESEIELFAKNVFAEIRRTEDLITNFKNVRSVRELLGIDPRFYEVQVDEQLSARVLLVGPDGSVFHLHFTFKTGEQWSFERLQTLSKATLAKRVGVGEGFSAYVSNSILETQYYVQTWQKIG